MTVGPVQWSEPWLRRSALAGLIALLVVLAYTGPARAAEDFLTTEPFTLWVEPLHLAEMPASTPAETIEPKKWWADLSLYLLAVQMSGDVGIGPVTADVDVDTEDILNNLEFGAMGTVRLGYGRWAFNTDVLYMGLQWSQNELTVNMDQWLVEPTISYRVCTYFEPLVGARYNNLQGEIQGPGVLPNQHIASGTQEWWDPIVGANLKLPLGKAFSLNLRADIGGFGCGSDLTWQLFPYLHWRFAKWGSLQAGYRWLYMDYETGSGANRFEYDMLNQGLQVGLTLHF